MVGRLLVTSVRPWRERQ